MGVPDAPSAARQWRAWRYWVIHRYWEGPGPDPYFPVAGATDWTPDTLPMQRPPGDSRQASNVIRFMLLHIFGGLWLDHDIRPIRPVEEWARGPLWVAGVGRQPEAGIVWAPRPGDPLMLEMAVWCALHPDQTAAAGLHAVLPARVSVRDWYSYDAAGRRRPGNPVVEHLWSTSGRLG